MNLFWSTRRLTQSREDHLTEFIAAALIVDSTFREAYADFLFSQYAIRKGWTKPKIKEVSTQVSYPDEGCRPDLVLGLDDGHVIACEHKIDAPETPGVEAGTPKTTSQLENYLNLPIDGLAYVRVSPQALRLSNKILRHKLYIKPDDGEHFLWRDLYPVLLSGNHELTRWIREGFERLGYTPPIDEIGDLNDSDPQLREKNRRNFAKLWDSTRFMFASLNWKVGRGSICELYLSDNLNAQADQVYISPLTSNGNILRIRITPRNPEHSGAIEDRLSTIAESLPYTVDVERHEVPRAGGRCEVVDVHVGLRELLRKSDGVVELEQTLWDHVGFFLKPVS